MQKIVKNCSKMAIFNTKLSDFMPSSLPRTTQPKKKYCSIGEAADFLEVSIDTLRRWEAKGKLKALRLNGKDRYFSFKELEKVKKEQELRQGAEVRSLKKKSPVVPVPKITFADIFQAPPVLETVSPQVEISRPAPVLSSQTIVPRVENVFPEVVPASLPEIKQELPKLYDLLHAEQKAVLKKGAWSATIIVLLLLFLKFSPAAAIGLASLDQHFQVTKKLGISFPEKALAQKKDSRVLGIADFLGDLIFQVNIPAEFMENVQIAKNLGVAGNASVSGDLAINGGDVTSGATTFNFLNTGAGVLNIGGAKANINLGSATGLVTVNNNLAVGDITEIQGVEYTWPTTQGSGTSFLKNDGSGALTWGTITQVSSFSDLSGVVPIANGGTNNSDVYTAGSIIFSDGTKLTQDNTNFFWDDSNNRLGILTSTPVAPLSVGAGSAFQVNSAGAIAAATGLTTSGTVTLSSFTNDGGVFYGNSTGVLAQTSTGTATQCLIGGSTPTWSDCASAAGSGQWQRNNGVISPQNITDDLALGGTATSSAKFQIFGGTGNATTSGNLTFNAAGVIQTTNNQTLTLGGNSTGNVVFMPNNGSGNVGIGTATPVSMFSVGSSSQFQVNSSGAIAAATGITSSGTITFSGFTSNGGVLYTNGSGVVAQTGTGTVTQCLIGGPTPTWLDCGTAGNNFWQRNLGALAPINITDDLLVGGTATSSAKFQVFANTGAVTQQGYLAAPGATFSATVPGNVPLTIRGTVGQTANLFEVKNSSDVTMAAIDRFGSFRIASSGVSSGVGLLNVTGAATGHAMAVFNETGDQAILTASASGATRFTIQNNGDLTATGAITGLTGYSQTTGNFSIAGAGTFSTGTGAITLNGDTTVSSGKNLIVASLNTAGGIVYTSSTGQLNTIAGTSGQCLRSGGVSAPAWVDCGTLVGWQRNNGVLSPYFITDDLAIGGTATSSAKFQVFGLTGNATTSGTLTFGGTSATNLITARNKAGITIGDVETGNVNFSTNTNVGFGITSPLYRVDIAVASSNTPVMRIGGTGTVIGGNTNGLLWQPYNASDASSTFNIAHSSLGSFRWTAGASTDPAVNTEIMRLTRQGNLGLGVAAPVGKFVVSGTSSVPGNALAIFNQTGAEDILTASASGVTRFTVANNGTLTASAYTNAGGVLYTSGSGVIAQTGTSVSTQCLIGGSTPSWSDCASAAGSVWQRNLGVVSPLNITDDLAIGGTATSSAKFQIFGLTGNATTSGTLTFDTAGVIQTTKNQTLTIGGNSTGNITISPNNGNGTTTNTGTFNLSSGKTYQINGVDVLSSNTLGSGVTTSSLTTVGALTSGSIANGFGTIDSNNTITGTTLNGTTGINSGAGAGTQRIDASGNLVNINNITAGGTVTFSSFGTGIVHSNSSGVLSSSAVDLASADVTGVLPINRGGTNSTATPTNGGVAYGDGSAYQFSSAGVLGQCLISGGAGTPTWNSCSASSNNQWNLANGAISPVHASVDVLIGASATTSAKFAFMNVNSGTPTASISAGTAGATYITADGSIQTTAFQNLTLGGSTTGSITLDPQGGTGKVNSTGTLNLASGKTYQINGTDVLSSTTLGSAVTTSSLTTVGALTSGSIGSGFGTIATGNTITGTTINGTTAINTGAGAGTARIDALGNLVNINDITAGGTVTLSAFTNAGGVLYTNGSGVVAQTGTSTSSQCLIGGSTPSWSDCTSAVAQWQRNLGVLSPYNITDDLAIGGTSTSSAKFQVFGLTGSATMAGTLTTSTIQPPTGNLTLNYKSAANTWAAGLTLNTTGAVGIGTTSPTKKLHITTTGAAADGILLDGTGYNGVAIDRSATNRYAQVSFSTASSVKWQLGLHDDSTDTFHIWDVSGNKFLSITDQGSTGNIGINNVTPAAALDVTGTASVSSSLTLGGVLRPSTGNLTLQYKSGANTWANGLTLNTVGNLTAAGSISGLTGITSSGTITFSGFSNDGGILYTNGSGVVAQTAAGLNTQCLIGGANPSWSACSAASGNVWQLANGVISPLDISNDLAIGGTATASAKFQVFGLTGNATTSGTLTFDTAGVIQTTKNQTLTLGGNSTGNIDLSPINGSGNVTITGTSSLLVSSLNTAGGVIYANSVGKLLNNGLGSAGQCLTSGGAGAPSWTDCSAVAGVNNQWTVSNGVLYPIHLNTDLLVGGSSTASAKFAVLNVLTGTPTASVSAGAPGAAYLTADGTLATTALQNLTIGNATTGNVIFNPSRNVGIGDTTPASLFTVGSGDAFQVNASGAVAAATGITSSGTITFSGLTTNGGVVYTNGSGVIAQTATGTAGQCLISAGGSTPTWTDCGAASTSYWQRNLGVLSPQNITDDLAIGGTATSTAKFQVFGLTGNATTSGSLTFNGSGTNYINALGGQPLSLRTSPGGDAGLTDRLTILNSGNVGIGTATPGDKFTVMNGNVRLQRSDTTAIEFGSYWGGSTVYGTTFRSNLSSTSSYSSGYGIRLGSINSSNPTSSSYDQIQVVDTFNPTSGNAVSNGLAVVQTINQTGGASGVSRGLYVNPTLTAATDYRAIETTRGNVILGSTSGLVGIGTTAPISPLHISRGWSNNAALTVDNLTSGDLITASASGVTRLRITNTGEVLAGAGAVGTPTFSFTGDTNTGIYSSGTDQIGFTANGGQVATLDANAFRVVNGSAGTPSLSFLNDTNTGLWTNGSDIMGFSTAGTEAMRIDSSQNVGIGNTGTLDAKLDLISTTTTGKGIEGTFNSLTTGTGLNLVSTSTALTTGGLVAVDWSPGSATTATGDLMSLNIGGNGTIGNIFNVKNGGSSVFAVSQAQITAALPVNFTSPGDVSMAYDLNFTNQTSSFIKSNAPLYLEAGEIFESNDLTLRTFNAGNVVVDSQALTGRSASLSGQLMIGSTTVSPASIGGLYVTNGGTYGKAAAIINQTESQDIFSASASGTTRFTIASNGNITAGGTITGLTGITSSGTITFSGLTTNGGVVYTNGSGVLAQTGTSTATQCLIGGTTPSWSDCASAAGSVWQRNLGVVSPLNITDDLAIGGTATSSAKFQVFGLTGNASSAGSITASTFQPPTGNLTLNYKSAPNTWAAGLTLDTVGNIGIGTTTPGAKLDVNGDVWTNNGANRFTSTGFTRIGGANHYLAPSGGFLELGGASSAGLAFEVNGGVTRAMTIDTVGNVGVGTASPTAPLHIAGAYGSNDALTINQLNGGNIFTASASGTTKLTLENDGDLVATGTLTGLTGLTSSGTITLSAFSNNGGLLYTNGSGVVAQTAVGSGGECLKSAGGGSPTWGACDLGAGSSKWQVNLGVVSPYDISNDLAIGGTATASAKFQVFSGTGNATTSGNLTFNSAGQIQTTNNQTLTLGGNSTGNILLRPNNSTGRVGINVNAPIGTLELATLNSTVNATTLGIYNAVTDSGDISTVLEKAAAVNTIALSGDISGSSTGLTAYGTLSPISYSGDLTGTSETLTIIGNQGTATFTGTVGDNSNTASVMGLQGISTGDIGTTGTTAHYGGAFVTTGTADNNYAVYANAAGGTNNYGVYSIAGQNFFQDKVGIGAANVSPTAYLDVNGKVTGKALTILNETGDQDIFTASASGATRFTVRNNGDVAFTGAISGVTGYSQASGNFSISGAGTFSTGTGAVSLNGDTTIASGKTLSIASLNTAGAVAWLSGTGQVGATAAGTSGQCLVSGGAATPTWSECAQGANHLWMSSNGAIVPRNATMDLLVGGTSTASAKFAFMNVNSGTPTASISGNITLNSPNASAYMDVLGGKNFSVRLSPGGDAGLTEYLTILSNGNVGIGTSNPTSKLQIAGSTSTISNSSGDITINAASGNVSLNAGNLINFTQTNGALGSAGTPTYSFSGDTNTGIYSGAANTLKLVTDGSDRVTITSTGTVGIGTASPVATLQVNGANGSNAAMIINQANNGSVLAASTSGTRVFEIGKEGDATIGAQTKKDVNVSLFGDIKQEGSVELNAISNINDTFIYDTSKDSDYGAWTDSRLSRNLSWYLETKDDAPGDACSISGDDRCGERPFPKKATILATNDAVYIFDANSNKLWMKFTQTGTFALGADTNNNPSSVTALNGRIYIGTNGASATGVYVIDFKQDKMFRYDTVGKYDSGATTISGRNSSITYGNVFVPSISNAAVNDVSVTVFNGETYMAVANDTSVSLVNTSAGVVLDYSDVASDDYNAVTLTAQGDIVALNETQAQLERWSATVSDTASESAGTPDKVWDQASVPALSASTPTIAANAPSALYVDENSSLVGGASDTYYVGTDQGMTKISDLKGLSASGSAKYYTKDYVTEEMIGDVKGMWTFNESSGSLQDKSLNNNWLEDENAPTYGVSGVRGTGLSFDGAGDHLCSDANNDGTCDTDADYDFTADQFSVSLWFKHGATVNPVSEVLAQRYFNTTPAAQAGWQIRMAAGGQMTFEIDDDATFTPDDAASTSASLRYNDNKWHHLTATKDFRYGIRLYIDGVEVASDTSLTAQGSLSGTSNILGIGASCATGAACSTGAFFYNGLMDEVMITKRKLQANEVQSMYLSGKQALLHRSISVTDADINNASTTIGDSVETWTPNEFVGTQVEITGGTGAGQTRTVISNTATTLTVAPPWSTNPQSDSDFAIAPQELYGTTNTVKAVAVSDQSAGREKTLYVGSNDGSDAGGVSVFDADADSVNDIYHAGAGKLDESGTSWSATTNYDDITALDAKSGILVIGAQDQYWMEKESRVLSAELDRLRNEIADIKDGGGTSGVLAAHTQMGPSMNDSENGYMVIRKGWGWHHVSSGASTTSTNMNYGITYDEPPVVIANYHGGINVAAATTIPNTLAECTGSIGFYASTMMSFPGNITTSSFNMEFAISTGTFGVTSGGPVDRLCFSWIAIGSARSAYTGNSSPYAAGADVAEYYATDDKTLTAGEVVSISKAGDVKVVRSEGVSDPTAIGIISTKPGLTLGDQSGLTPGYKEEQFSAEAPGVAVALAGRVPVKVSLENGVIEPGDYLTTSSTPGVVMRATKAGSTIGRAMERFDGRSTIVAIGDANSTLDESITSHPATQSGVVSTQDKTFADLDKGIGVIMAFVDNSYYNPQTANTMGSLQDLYNLVFQPSTDASGSVQPTLLGQFILQTSLGEVVEQAIVGSEAMLGQVTAGDITAQSITTNELTIKDMKLDDYIAMIVKDIQDKKAAEQAEKDAVTASASAELAALQSSTSAELVASTSSSLLDSLLANGSTATNSSIVSILGAGSVRRPFTDLNLGAMDISLNAATVNVSKQFEVGGNAFIGGDAGISNSLILGQGLRFNDREINFMDTVPADQRTLSLLNNTLKISEKGEVIVTGKFKTNSIEPATYDQALQVKIATQGAVAGTSTDSATASGSENGILNSRFEIVNQDQSPVATISADGAAQFKGNVSVSGAFQLSDQNIGEFSVPAGRKEVRFFFPHEFTRKIFISLTATDGLPNDVSIKDIDGAGFTVVLPKVSPTVRTFNWFAVERGE